MCLTPRLCSLIDGPEVEHGAHFLLLYYPGREPREVPPAQLHSLPWWRWFATQLKKEAVLRKKAMNELRALKGNIRVCARVRFCISRTLLKPLLHFKDPIETLIAFQGPIETLIAFQGPY
jgi:hypothetical protein